MFITLYQVKVTQDHNRRSVIPYLELHSIGNPDSNIFTISLKNTGLGPAILTGVDFRINGNVISFPRGVDWDIIRSHIEKDLSVDLTKQGIMFANFAGKPLIPAGGKIDIIAIQPSKVSKESILTLNKIIEKIDPAFCYRSMYADRYFLKGISDEIGEHSCNVQGAYKVLGTYIRPKAPWKETLSHKDIFGE